MTFISNINHLCNITLVATKMSSVICVIYLHIVEVLNNLCYQRLGSLKMIHVPSMTIIDYGSQSPPHRNCFNLRDVRIDRISPITCQYSKRV